jgi:hypothetical protein
MSSGRFTTACGEGEATAPAGDGDAAGEAAGDAAGEADGEPAGFTAGDAATVGAGAEVGAAAGVLVVAGAGAVQPVTTIDRNIKRRPKKRIENPFCLVTTTIVAEFGVRHNVVHV